MPACPLNTMMINRHFYTEATNIWFRDTTILPSSNHLNYPSTEDLPVSLRGNTTRLELSWQYEGKSQGSLYMLKAWPVLRSLRVRVCNGAFDDVLEDKLACVDKLGETDFGRLPSVQVMRSMKTLQTVKLRAGTCNNAENFEHVQMFHANVAALERYITAEIARPATAEEMDIELKSTKLKQAVAKFAGIDIEKSPFYSQAVLAKLASKPKYARLIKSLAEDCGREDDEASVETLLLQYELCETARACLVEAVEDKQSETSRISIGAEVRPVETPSQHPKHDLIKEDTFHNSGGGSGGDIAAGIFAIVIYVFLMWVLGWIASHYIRAIEIRFDGHGVGYGISVVVEMLP